MEPQSELFTKDLYEAAFLFAQGQKLIRLERDRSIYWFVFRNDNYTADQLRDLFWSGEGLVSGRSYADAIRTLKDRLFAQR
jgi:hypothetical protein